jgi:hypothetical protein
VSCRASACGRARMGHSVLVAGSELQALKVFRSGGAYSFTFESWGLCTLHLLCDHPQAPT